MGDKEYFNMDEIRRRYSAPYEKLDLTYKSGFSQQQRHKAFQQDLKFPSFLLTKVTENEELEIEDPFEEFHLSPEKRIIKTVNNLRWRVDGPGRNRTQSLIDEFIDEVNPDLNRMGHNSALLGIHRFVRRRRNRRRWAIFDQDDEVRNCLKIIMLG